MSSKSVGDGSIPQWMKSKTEAGLNLDDFSSMSPPAHDESFFYIRFPTQQKKLSTQVESVSSTTTTTTTSTTTATTHHQLTKKNVATLNNDAGNRFISNALTGSGGNFVGSSPTSDSIHDFDPDLPVSPPVDLSVECKKYLAGLENATSHFTSTKPKGTDDDFKTAACAGSLVKVAQQFVGGTNKISKRFTVARIDEHHDDHAPPMDEADDNLQHDPKLMQRRSSQSLPASPLHSPKTMRKFQQQPNPYFTITASDNAAPKQSWLLASLLGARRELTSSTVSMSSQIDEADELIQSTSTMSLDQQQTSGGSAIKKEEKPTKPQPTMLREMNFWAPTSY